MDEKIKSQIDMIKTESALRKKKSPTPRQTPRNTPLPQKWVNEWIFWWLFYYLKYQIVDN